MNSLFPNNRRLLRISVAVAGGALWGMILLGYYSLVHCPIELRGEAQRDRINKLQVELNDNSNVYATNRKLKSTLGDLQEQIDTIRRRVPNEPLEAQFLSDATTIAEEERLDIIDFHRQAIDNFADYSEVEVVIRGQGSYDSICRFLDRVNKLLDQLTGTLEVEVIDVENGVK